MKRTFLKTILFVAFAIISLLTDSCKKRNLDLLPHGETESGYFKTEWQFERAVLGVYAKMTDFFWYNAGADNTTIPMFLLPGDDITTNNNNEEFETFGLLEPSSGRDNYLYSRLYQLIARANTVLDKVETVEPGVYITPNLKDYHKGEALFLRGYAYYNLWNFWGTSPLRVERADPENLLPSSTTGTQLLDQAISDFAAAAALLPASWNDANRGRVTANSANGMLGKSLVFRASATQTTTDYSDAINAFNAITGVSLIPNFDDNFAFDTENNGESLFEFQASQAFGFDNVWLDNDFDNAVGALSIFWGFYEDNYALFGTSRFYGTQKLLSAFDPDDPRLPLTINPSDRTVAKYAARNKSNQPGASSVNNYRILRFADVLLLKAEAILQSGGSTEEAIDLINQVRTRARNISGGNGIQPADLSNAESDRNVIMQWIMDERLRELGGEGQRWFDLRRWQMQGIINLDNAFFSSNVSDNINFQTKHLYFPIPNSEIDVNPNVVQNPGY
jgi:starch-binding outer membrane protein, SusD/RagB family